MLYKTAGYIYLLPLPVKVTSGDTCVLIGLLVVMVIVVCVPAAGLLIVAFVTPHDEKNVTMKLIIAPAKPQIKSRTRGFFMIFLHIILCLFSASERSERSLWTNNYATPERCAIATHLLPYVHSFSH